MDNSILKKQLVVKLTFKNNFLGYFNFYYRIIGNSFFLYLGLSIIISLLDGFGLAMFIPLLQVIGNESNAQSSAESLGNLKYVIEFIQSIGFQLSINSILIFICSLFLLKGCIKYVHQSYNAAIRYSFIKKIRFQLLSNLQDISYRAFVKLDAGRIQNTLTTEMSRLLDNMTYYFSAAQYSIMLGTYVILAFLSNYQFALLLTIGGFLSNLLYKRIHKLIVAASLDISKKHSDFNGFLIQAVHYFKYLKSTNSFKSYGSKLKDVISETVTLNKKTAKLKATMLSIKEPVIIMIVCLVIIVQVNFMNTHLSTIILSLFLFYRALSFLISLQNDYQCFMENIGAMHAVATLSDEMHDLKEVSGTKVYSGIRKQLQFKDVVFTYDRKKALDHINLTLPAKQTIALVGESGSGKTTIANMIAGLLKPDSGKILIDNVSLEDIDLSSYRDKIGYISQESVIFSDTIYNNVTFWASPTKENFARFENALKMASLLQFVQSLPDKEHTKLGNNGILISGGQKQRISIARELYKEAEILIFDEATSALDSETEKIIQENVNKLQGNYTIILIAHRLSTIKNADIIYLLEDGHVTASGSFDDMIHTSSRFKKMVSLQMV